MAKQDYYELLGVNKDAGLDEIKKAYRKAAMQYHPDRNPGDAEAEQKFKDVSEAYDVLRDEQKRAAYDRFGHAAFEGGGGPGGAGGGFGGFGAGGFADIFDEMFGDMMGGRRRGQAGRGSDLRFDLEISLEDAFHGKTAQIRVPTSVACESCEGTGAEAGTQPTACGTCHGQGQVIEDPCGACGGNGRVHREKTLEVVIPEGVEDGSRIRLAGEGEAGLRGAPSGDLYIFLSIKPHPLFSRDGPHLRCTVPITMTQAALGDQIEVPVIDGSKTKVKIPQGTQSGQHFRLRGKGMTMLRRDDRGDLYVTVKVETPVNLTKRQKELLHEFDAESKGKKHHPEGETFFSKVKDFFESLAD